MAARDYNSSDVYASRIKKLVSYCRTQLAVKLCGNSSVLIGVSLLCKTDCYKNCSENLSNSCAEGGVCRSFESRAGTPQETTFQRNMAGRANSTSSVMVAAQLQDTLSIKRTGRTAQFLQTSACRPADVWQFICCHYGCRSFFGGTLTRAITSSSSTASECVAYPYAAFMMLCYKSACSRLCAEFAGDNVQAVQGELLLNTTNSCCHSDLQNHTVPGYSPETDTERVISGESIISNSKCSQTSEAVGVNCVEGSPHNIDAVCCEQMISEDLNSLEPQCDSGYWEENSTQHKSFDNCIGSSVQADSNSCCSMAWSDSAVSYCADRVAVNEDACTYISDICSYQSETTNILLNNSSNGEEIMSKGSCTGDLAETDEKYSDSTKEDEDEDSSDDDSVEWKTDSDSADESAVPPTAKSLSRKPMCSSFFVRASDVDDSDTSSDSGTASTSDNDEQVGSDDDWDDDNDDEDEDDDWSTTREPADLSCFTDLDPFQISGLYIPPMSTTPCSRPIAACSAETAKVEHMDTESSTKMKSINEKWKKVYESTVAPVTQTASTKKVSSNILMFGKKNFYPVNNVVEISCRLMRHCCQL
jgi:hypothetical protein